MTHAECLLALHRMKVEAGNLVCLGCGHEHNCGVHGCAILREVEQKLIDIEWRNADYELPVDDKFVLALVSGKPRANIKWVDTPCIAHYYDSDGWIVEEYPDWENPTVKWWMPIKYPEVSS